MGIGLNDILKYGLPLGAAIAAPWAIPALGGMLGIGGAAAGGGGILGALGAGAVPVGSVLGGGAAGGLAGGAGAALGAGAPGGLAAAVGSSGVGALTGHAVAESALKALPGMLKTAMAPAMGMPENTSMTQQGGPGTQGPPPPFQMGGGGPPPLGMLPGLMGRGGPQGGGMPLGLLPMLLGQGRR